MAIQPGEVLGMLGGGQLGRMFVVAARTMGYEVVVLDPDANSPAGKLASKHLQAAYDDHEALDYMVERCAAVSTEFENIPAGTLEYLDQHLPVHPSASALRIAQNRLLEKDFFTAQGLQTAEYCPILSVSDVTSLEDFPFPAILKTSTLGYDGKGQIVCESIEDLLPAYQQIGVSDCVLEERIDLEIEVSVVLCRSESGDINCFPVAENEHAGGILDVSIAPARISSELESRVLDAASRIADGLDYCGVLAVEFFISKHNQVLVNEMAPRPHNSGHYTLDACETSQFEQQVRMICGLAAGSTRQHTPVAMWNIMGDIWPPNSGPEWSRILELPAAKLHLYGKSEARAGRKMGHLNCLADDTSKAIQLLTRAKQQLLSS